MDNVLNTLVPYFLWHGRIYKGYTPAMAPAHPGTYLSTHIIIMHKEYIPTITGILAKFYTNMKCQGKSTWKVGEKVRLFLPYTLPISPHFTVHISPTPH